MKTEKGTYHFKLNGDFITKFLREISIDDLAKAIDIGINDIGLSYQQSFSVCVGHMKLCGTGNLYLSIDSADSIHGKKLYQIGAEKFDINYIEQIPLLETPFKI